MVGIDTNVLVRYIVQDDPKQSAKAVEFIESKAELDIFIVINGIVLCELVWVLETAYGYNKKTIANVLEQILKTRQFEMIEAEVLWLSLAGYKNDGADFADHYIANLNNKYGCEYTATFDKKTARIKNIKILQ